MTANEMRRYGLQLLDGASLTEMGYTDSEWSLFLSQAQYEFVKNRMESGGLEFNAKRDTELVMLKAYKEVTTSGSPKIETSDIYKRSTTNCYVVELESDFMYNLQERVIQTKGTIRYEGSIKPIDEDCINENLENPFNRPDKYLMWRITNANGTTKKRQVILVGSYDMTLTTYQYRYLRRPPDIVVSLAGSNPAPVDCILDPAVHEEIVQIAVKKILAASGSNKYQIADKEEKEDI